MWKANVRLLVISCFVFVVALLGFDRSLISFVALKSGFGATKEEQRIKSTLKLYNSCFVDFHDSGGVPERLNDFPAVTQLRHEVFREMGFLAANQRIMIYDSAEQKVLKITFISPGKAEVDVIEEWNFLYQKLKDRKPFTKIRGFSQGLSYKLGQVRGQWVVQEWEPKEIKSQVKNNEFYF